MIVQISTSGGMGGFGLGKEARVELDNLPEEVRTKACEMMTDDDLSVLAKSDKDAMPDGISYVITLEDAKGKHVYKINEGVMAPEMLDLVDELMIAEE